MRPPLDALALPHHISKVARPYDRGLEFGSQNAESVANTLAVYDRLFSIAGWMSAPLRAFGEEVRQLLEARYPDVSAEIDGIADGAGKPRTDLFAANARTELLASPVGECSTIAIVPGEGTSSPCILAQNWDYHPDLRPSRIIWQVEREQGWFVTFTEAGILGKIGINQHGLGMCLNSLKTTADRAGVRTPIHVLLRLVLQNCPSVAEAETMLSREAVSASACVTLGQVVDARSVVSCVELSPGGATVIHASRGEAFVHTNHFLVPPRAGTDVIAVTWPDTHERRDHLVAALKAGSGPPDVAAVERLLKSHGGRERSVCCHAPAVDPYQDRSETLASVIIDLRARRFLVSNGAPCENSYTQYASRQVDEPRASPRLSA